MTGTTRLANRKESDMTRKVRSVGREDQMIGSLVTVLCAFLAIAPLASALERQTERGRRNVTSEVRREPTLKDAFREAFLIGASINRAQIYERDARGLAVISRHFNAITSENVLKWEAVHPAPDRYAFEAADLYVAFGEKHGMVIIGHTLIWHDRTPRWVFEDELGRPVSREVLLQRMREHIQRVVGRYRGLIRGWDVVNEALVEDGTLRQSPWLKTIGEDHIAKAFQFAHEADPQAELYYNDYSLENGAKRRGAIALIKKLKAQGVPITAIGLQEHNGLDWPSVERIDAAIRDFAALGIKVNVTELDVSVLPWVKPGSEAANRAASDPALNPYVAGLPDEVQQKLARRYAELFKVYLKHRDVIDRVNFWNVTDADSWLNDFPAPGRTDYPLLFDRAGRPKPAFYSVIEAAGARTSTRGFKRTSKVRSPLGATSATG